MKRCMEIGLSSMVALFLCAGVTAGQVGSDGNLAYTVSNSNLQLDVPPANNPSDLVIRNRLDSGCPWTISADAMIMSRSGGKSSLMVVDPISGGELLHANDFNFAWAAGPRVGIVAEDVCCCCDLEASYFGIDEWSAGKNIIASDDGAEFLFFNDPGHAVFLDSGELLDFHYISSLHSVEINLRHPIWDRLSVLMGFRYVELHEELNVREYDPIEQSYSSLLTDNVDNHLYGGQIGLNVAFINTCSCSIEGVIKAGVYGNSSDLVMRASDRLLGDATSHTAILGEIGLMGIFQLTDHLAARLGYQAMWLDGIAIASDQVESVNPANPKPYMGGTLFYHGATAGFEYAF